jgi:hypothetical protein
MCLGKSGYFGIVLCRDNENCLSDHMVIKRHDDSYSNLLSLIYIQISPNSYVFGVVLSLTQSISRLCYVEPMKSNFGDQNAIKGHDGPNSDLLSLSYNQTSLNSYVFEVRPSRPCVLSRL